MSIFKFGKKQRSLCLHDLEAFDVEQLNIEIMEQLYTEKPNTRVTYKCKFCSHTKIKELHMPGGHIKKFTIEDFQ